MKRWILALVTVIALSVVAVGTASAQGFGGYGGYGCAPGYGGIGYSAGYAPSIAISGYGGGGYGAGLSTSGYGGYNPGIGVGYGVRPQFHQPHLDYHPATVRRHWGHLDVISPHYDLHRSRHHH